jgi:uncharacterized protein
MHHRYETEVEALREFFAENPASALGLSGGSDSAFLLHFAISNGAHIRAYNVRTVFQPSDAAERAASREAAALHTIDLDIMRVSRITDNPPDRCYHCKTEMFSAIVERAATDGLTVVIDGTNASDDPGNRPGMRALEDLGVRSPLRECGLTKDAVRELSRDAGLPTWDKPSFSCLATRIPVGTRITEEGLRRTAAVEDAPRGTGFSDVRVTSRDGCALNRIPPAQMADAVMRKDAITACPKKDYGGAALNPERRE